MIFEKQGYDAQVRDCDATCVACFRLLTTVYSHFTSATSKTCEKRQLIVCARKGEQGKVSGSEEIVLLPQVYASPYGAFPVAKRVLVAVAADAVCLLFPFCSVRSLRVSEAKRFPATKQ